MGEIGAKQGQVMGKADIENEPVPPEKKVRAQSVQSDPYKSDDHDYHTIDDYCRHEEDGKHQGGPGCGP